MMFDPRLANLILLLLIFFFSSSSQDHIIRRSSPQPNSTPPSSTKDPASSSSSSHQQPIVDDHHQPGKRIEFGEKFEKGSYRLIQNSGICETTPGLLSVTGYIEIEKNQSMFFWYYSPRRTEPKPNLAVWLNGGPGCSSAIGVFQEIGPCKISPDGSKSSLNPYAWNEVAHVLFLDQPISTGFSYGIDDVYTTSQAAIQVWDFLQMFFSIEIFKNLKDLPFSLCSESYGGHFVPAMSQYFHQQNQEIYDKKISGYRINLQAQLINNGWFNPVIQYESYLDFAQKKYNHLFDLVDQKTLDEIKNSLYQKETGCKDRLMKCNSFKGMFGDQVCKEADEFCAKYVALPAQGDRNPYFLLRNSSDPFPSDSYMKFLKKPEVLKKIGAETDYQECNDAPYNQFSSTGDDAKSSIPALAESLNRGLRTIIWVGTLDFICNVLGVLRSIEAMKWNQRVEFLKAEWKPFKIKEKTVGIYKIAGPLTFIQIYNAGHEVSAYQPAAALAIFHQTVMGEKIHSI